MMVADFDLSEVVRDLKEADPNMPQTELFDHCMAIGRKNGMSAEHIAEQLREILK